MAQYTNIGGRGYFLLGDKSTMAMYIENVLLPKQLTDSFYTTWMHCYEELFDATIAQRSSSGLKFERTYLQKVSSLRPVADGIADGREKFELLADSKARSLPFDLNRNTEVFKVSPSTQSNPKSGMYSSHKIFPIGKKKTYYLSDRHGDVRVSSP